MIKTLDYADTQEGGEKGRAFELEAHLVAAGDSDIYLIPDDVQNIAVSVQGLYGATAAVYSTTDTIMAIKKGYNTIPDITKTGSITEDSLTVAVATTGLAEGNTVSGTGIPTGATIASVDGSAAVTLDASASVTDASAAITFGGRTLTLSWEKWSGGDATTLESANYEPVSAIKMTQTGDGESRLTLRAQ